MSWCRYYFVDITLTFSLHHNKRNVELVLLKCNMFCLFKTCLDHNYTFLKPKSLFYFVTESLTLHACMSYIHNIYEMHVCIYTIQNTRIYQGVIKVECISNIQQFHFIELCWKNVRMFFFYILDYVCTHFQGFAANIYTCIHLEKGKKCTNIFPNNAF